MPNSVNSGDVKRCCKQYWQVKFKGTMTKWPVQKLTLRTAQNTQNTQNIIRKESLFGVKQNDMKVNDRTKA